MTTHRSPEPDAASTAAKLDLPHPKAEYPGSVPPPTPPGFVFQMPDHSSPQPGEVVGLAKLRPAHNHPPRESTPYAPPHASFAIETSAVRCSHARDGRAGRCSTHE
jgi:hypothetical protein